MQLLTTFKRIFSKLKLRELSTVQKIYVAIIAVSCCLVFYAVGIITDFFANPVFSMFFVLSYDEAHNIVSYIALGAAITLGIVALTVGLVKRRKSVLLIEPEYEPAIDNANAPVEVMTQATSSGNIQELINPADTSAKQESLQDEEPVVQPIGSSATESSIYPESDKNMETSQATGLTADKDKITCPACNKEFSIPVFMLDYTGLKPKLVRHCPYCDQVLDSEQKTIEEDSFLYSPVDMKTE
jgi:hypothetical protein